MTHPIVHPQTPRVAVAAGCTLGEGPVWDHRTGTLLWVDIKRPAVWRFEPATGASSRLDVGERIGFVALTAHPDLVIAGYKSGLVRLDLRSAAAEPLLAPEPDKPQNRLNDGHVGPDGVLYFGTMHDEETEPTGSFWRWDGGEARAFHGGITVPNGPAVSPDGRILYTVDSPNRRVFAHSLGNGFSGEARPFLEFEQAWGHPDGLAVDADGFLWICHWGGSRITRFAPNGTPERVLPVPTAQVTKCAFGGPDLTTLYITTAGIGRDPHIDPMAGHLFAVDAGIRGLPANIFADAAPS
jgi:sugar lactone lactonase YvrE